jgi:hypothetical protein
MKFKEIPKVTRSASYRVDRPWRFLETALMEVSTAAGSVNLDPVYQRGHVWTVEQQQKYVEHILRGGTSGREIYCNCPGWMYDFAGPYEVVDGKQRITAVLAFLRNELPVFNGTYFRDFEDPLPYDAAFSWHVNDLPDQASVMRWYLEMNEGLTAHTTEELERVRQLLVTTETP